MIKIIATYEEDALTSLEVKGHAEYEKHGKDIVCAGVSVLLETLHFAMDAFDLKKELYSITKKNGYFLFVCNKTLSSQYIVQVITSVILMGLHGITCSHTNFVKIYSNKNIEEE